jgi:hypothetical protein
MLLSYRKREFASAMGEAVGDRQVRGRSAPVFRSQGRPGSASRGRIDQIPVI